MKALVLIAPGKIEIVDVPQPILSTGKALVKLRSVTLNRRDQWIIEGKYPHIRFGAILGSDGCGVVETVFDDANQSWVGQEVVINPNVNWGQDPEVQSRNYTILG